LKVFYDERVFIHQGVGLKMEIRMAAGRAQAGFLIDKEIWKSSHSARMTSSEMPVQMKVAEFLNLYYLEKGF
jgi:hypothetical protein